MKRSIDFEMLLEIGKSVKTEVADNKISFYN